MTLVSATRIEERRTLSASGRPLAGLYDSLSTEIEPLLARALYVPGQKALLSREGGRCPHDGTTLEFDPFSPAEHRCPSCGRIHRGELHDRAWITWYQLWLAERAVHASLFHRLRGDARHLDLASGILSAYVERYLAYPNVDNVLGPSRLFFSTYLESIWLLQVCVATGLLPAGHRALAASVRERVIEPARAMIVEFDEGRSNRQVWNVAALLAAASACGDAASARAAIEGRSGLLALLEHALLPDGSWYEGENYHQFALRGLWYGVTLAEEQGIVLPTSLLARYDRAFAIPFATALPDFTMPSRKDSQYAVSLRQWRLAELTELGYARTGDPVLLRALARCYEPGHPRRETGRARSAADAERNTPSGALTREDLSWRALLFAAPTLPAATDGAPRSVNLGAQGYAVFRRDPDVYVGFDYGQSGGGHGHPDRLNLTMYQGDTRWLDDLGTGSYVDPSLHWYRSTLAHNAPLVNGRSQLPLDGVLTAYDEREGMGWVAGAFDARGDAVHLERAIMVGADYLIDELSWSSDGVTPQLDLPLHLEGHTSIMLAPSGFTGGRGLEDGFDFVTGARSAELPAGRTVHIAAERDGRTLHASISCNVDATLFEVAAPGQPSGARRRFFVVRASAPKGRMRSVIAWVSGIRVSDDGEALEVVSEGGERHRHRRDASGWHVELHAGGARSSIDLAGFVSPADRRPEPSSPLLPRELRSGETLRFRLGRDHYRRSEVSWEDAGSPVATIDLARDGRTLVVAATIRAGDLLFPASDAVNDFDNEHADSMGAGLQLYLKSGGKEGGWSLVPDEVDTLRVREIGAPSVLPAPRGEWRATGDGGYAVRVRLPLPDGAFEGDPFHMDVHINETVRGRVRRRGQLVLSGADGGWVYLRGDRHDDARWLYLRLA